MHSRMSCESILSFVSLPFLLFSSFFIQFSFEISTIYLLKSLVYFLPAMERLLRKKSKFKIQNPTSKLQTPHPPPLTLAPTPIFSLDPNGFVLKY